MDNGTEARQPTPGNYGAAVIGLGNIGFRFSADRKRKQTWSHAAAYGRCRRTRLAAAADPDPAARAAFARVHPEVPVFADPVRMMEALPIDIVSVCTPTGSHWPVVSQILGFPVKAVFCEKPLAKDPTDARRIVEGCRRSDVVLAVNYIRRWDPHYRHVRRIIQRGAVGPVQRIHATYSGQLYNIGSHLLDTVNMLWPARVVALSGFGGVSGGDPDISGWLQMEDGACLLSATARHRDLLFEIDLFGTEGRIRSLDNGERIELYRFEPSRRYSNYRELVPVDAAPAPSVDRFVAAVDDICAVMDGDKTRPECSGAEALAVQSLLLALEASARAGGAPTRPDGSL